MRITEGNTNIRGKTARFFFAIWPDDTAQKQLALLAERLQAESLCSGQKTQTENIHLTLVFVGEADVDKLKTLRVIADGIKGPSARAFDFVIKEICYWKHNQIAYAAACEAPQELMCLVSALQDALFAAGFPIERRPYKPHITLMRKASCYSLPKLAKPIAWQAREWILVKSEQTSGGPVYIPIGRWPLGNP
jgi:RNA 2',3'-cyclic 3'-phosphodiesterase